MKTLEELYTEVMGNEEAKVAFVEAIKANDTAAFMAANDCDATQEELNEFIGLKMAEDGPMELDMDKLAEIAGEATSRRPCTVPPEIPAIALTPASRTAARGFGDVWVFRYRPARARQEPA